MGEEWIGSFKISRYKLLYTKWTNKKVLLYSTGNYGQYSAINHHEKNMKINIYTYIYDTHIYIYVYIYTVQQKLTQYCKSTTLQFFFK